MGRISAYRGVVKALIPVLVAILCCGVLPAQAEPAYREDVPVGSLPSESVTAALRKTLSPQGRFVILGANGMVRIFDTPAKIAEARKVLQNLQEAPSIVTFAIDVRAGMHRVVRQAGQGPVTADYEIPVPQTYSPPRIAGDGGRGSTVVPGMPGNFTVRHVDQGDRVYVNPGYVTGGYVSGVEVRKQTSAMEGGANHRYAGSTAFPKPVAVMVSPAVDDPASLHDWAVKNGAVPAGEPVWTNARTELVVTPEHAADGLLLNLMPRIVLPGAPGQQPRLIPVKVCATSVLTKRGAPTTLEGFPNGDAEFYRLFFNAKESTADTSVLITVAAGNEYLPPVAVK